MALLAMALTTLALLTMALLTMAPLTMALLTTAPLTMAGALCLSLPWLHLLYQVRFGIYDRHLASGPANAHEVLIESVLASLGL